MSDRVLTACADGILTVTLNRPDKRNALDTAMVDGLHAALERADLDAEVRVMLVRGEGKDFCAGADLAELLASADAAAVDNARSAERLGQVFIGMRELPKPVVAAVHGRALAGGCGLATAADLVVAAPDASFGYPEIRRGFVPAMVMAMLVRAVGEPVAFDLVATGRVVPAREACALGLIARVAEEGGDVWDTAYAVSNQLASSSASALGLLKKELYALDGRTFAAAIRLGAEVNATARGTPDFKAAVAEFLQH